MDPSTIEHQIALRQLLVKTDESSSWFIKVKHILHKYDLPEPEYLLQNIRSDRSKQYWKRVMKRHVDSFWHFQNQQEVNEKSTLSHFKLQENSARFPHQLWLGSKYSPSASRKAAIKAKIVTNTYRLQSNKAKFNKYEVNPTCVMCDEGDETREHFILTCKALSQKRDPYLARLTNMLTPILGNLDTNTEKLFELIVDCSSTRLDSNLTENNNIQSQIESIGRDLLYTLHCQRATMLRHIP